MAKKRIISIVALSAFLLVGCSPDARDFVELEKIEHVEVVDTGTRMVGKTSYKTITYLSNETGDKVKSRFKDTGDYGFDDFYDSAKVFEEKIYVDLVVNDNENIISIVLSEEVKSNGKR